jgi:hypothetical protein
VKIPCNDERDFYARLADHIATRGLRVPTEDLRPVGTRLQVALEFRNGRTLRAQAIVDAHVQVDSRSGVNVRFLHLEPDEPLAPAAHPPPLPGSRAGPAASDGSPASPPGSMPLEDELSGDTLEPLPDAPPEGVASLTASTEIGAMLDRRGARIRRAAIVVLAATLVLAVAVWAMVRRAGQPATPDEVVAAHVQASDRLVSEGRVTGKAARSSISSPPGACADDARTNERLSRLADALEGLGARALERGDLAVASIHLQDALAAAPDRASIRAKLDALEKKKRPDGSREKRKRKAAKARRQ